MTKSVTPSASFVDDSSRAVSSSLKAICKQMFMLNASYQKKAFPSSGESITHAIQEVFTCINTMQQSLTAAAREMSVEMESEDSAGPGVFPEEIVITGKEYAFLNAVFIEYTENITSTSREFSLFSSHRVDQFPTPSCLQDSDTRSNDSCSSSQSHTA